MLQRAVEASGEVAGLEDALNRNLAALAGAKHFEQTVLGLAATIHLLNARLAELARRPLDPTRIGAAQASRRGMKAHGAGEEPARPAGSPALSLFPFLAVLICTMGALVLLLLAVTRQARLAGVARGRGQRTQQEDDRGPPRESAQWRIEQLEEVARGDRVATGRRPAGRWATSRTTPGGSRQQLAPAYVRPAGEADRNGAGPSDGGGSRRELRPGRDADWPRPSSGWTKPRTGRKPRPRSYAIVPYEGPNQTASPADLPGMPRRRRVVLQPENIVFSEADFDGPMGPGNPLAAALRAAREYLLAQGGFDPRAAASRIRCCWSGPAASSPYYAARAAMKSWGSEFGYELIGDDWKLHFPPPDPRLAQGRSPGRPVGPGRTSTADCRRPEPLGQGVGDLGRFSLGLRRG